MLSVSVVLSVSVEGCQAVSSDVLLRSLFERHDAVSHVCSARKNTKIRMSEKTMISAYDLLRWPVLRLHVLLDGAAAALDTSLLQTFANTGD